MKPLFITSLLIISVISLEAQNLVKNPGFELFYDCPIRIGEFNKTKDWFSANTGTPELYHLECQDFFPDEKLTAFDGKGYAGLIAHCQYKEAIEYIGTELSDSLLANQDYCLSFHVKAKRSPFYIANIGAIFRDKDPSISYWGGIRDLFDVRNEHGFITPENAWVQVSGKYRAKGGERFLIIGNFAEADQTATIADTRGKRPQMGWMSYYYIDNVQVFEMDEESTCPLEKESPKILVASEKPIDSLRFTLYFDFDQKILKATEKKRLDSILEAYKTFPCEFILVGHTDHKGSDSYNQLLSKQRAQHIKALIEKKSRLKVPIKFSFDGESSPAQSNQTFSGRAANRRVEVLLIKHEKTQ